MASNSRPWTEAQIDAIDTRDRTMLLSAAAGSGKTAVLTDRIICSLWEQKPTHSLSRILAVTFTRSAAAEMRERITKALDEAIHEHPENEDLQKQLQLLPSANISTIDSFCIFILRRFASYCGVSPAFRVADTQEARLLRAAIMEELLDHAYHGKVPNVTQEAFATLVSHLGDVKSERNLGEWLLNLVYKLDTFEKGADILFDYANDLLSSVPLPLEDTPWYKQVQEYLIEACQHSIGILNKDIDALLHDPLSDDKLLSIMETYRNNMVDIAAKGYYDASLHNFSNLSVTTGHKKTELEEEAAARAKDLKNLVIGIHKTYFSCGESFWRYTFSTLGEAIFTLAHVIREFQSRYERECNRRGAYDFSIITRLAHRLLVKDGAPTECALALRKEFDAVYVDEYQDVNSLQHSIFEAIAPETGRFLVGDIKQSIYRFREADPSVFAFLRETFPPLDLSNKNATASHFMSQNFRSEGRVVDFINVIFDFLFENAGASIGYQSKDRLECAKVSSPVHSFPVPTVVFFDSKKGVLNSEKEVLEFAQSIAEGEHIPPTTEEDMKEASGEDIHVEARWVAHRIHRLAKERNMGKGMPLTYKDIAVIGRSMKSQYRPYLLALQQYGIPCKKPEDSEFFVSPEVLLSLALLNTIENPRRDVHLTATLCSPLYRFSPDELALVRHETQEGLPFYDALCQYCEAHKDFDKGHFFLSQLASFREAAETIPVDKLLRRIFDETPLMSIAGADTEGGENNLQLLYNYARTFVGASFSGLYNFIHFIDKQIKSGSKFSTSGVSKAADSVELCTTHASKGLEYPVVFLVQCGTYFKTTELSDTFLCSRTKGLSFHLRDASGLVHTTHPVHLLMHEHLRRTLIEEEMRLLYVALTRAKEFLFVTGRVHGSTTLANTEKKLQELLMAPSAYGIFSLGNYLQMIYAALLSSKEKNKWHMIVNPEIPPIEVSKGMDTQIDPIEVQSLADTLRERIDFVYPNAHLVRLPKKLSVSRLKPGILDDAQEETTHYEREEESLPKEVASPVAVQPVQEEEDRPEKWNRLPLAYIGATKAKATDRGIATHIFMQFCDFDNLVNNGVAAETKRLLAKGYLSQQQADILRPHELELFRRSTLIETMRGAKNTWTELRFNIHLPAHLFTDDPDFKVTVQGETIFVQGVIDAIIETHNGELILVDYKTDRLTHEERNDLSLAAEKLRNRHSQQLTYYGEAVKAIFGKAPSHTLIYALQLGTTIEV